MDFAELLEIQKGFIRYSEDVYVVRRRLNTHLETLENSWRSAEADTVIWALDELCDELRRIEYEMADLGHDFVKRAEILAEEI